MDIYTNENFAVPSLAWFDKVWQESFEGRKLLRISRFAAIYKILLNKFGACHTKIYNQVRANCAFYQQKETFPTDS